MVVAMYKRLEASKPPPKPEIEIISNIVSQFKTSMESSDVNKVKSLSQFEAGREQFVDQFFANYQSFKMNVSGFQFIANEHKATAKVSLSRLVNKKGHAVQPGAWGEFSIVVQKNSAGQWRVNW
jgi:RNA-binding protein YhbY